MDMERERLKLMLNQDMVMVDMVMEDPMEAMVVTEAMVVMVMEREMPSQVMDMVVTEDLMEVMVDTEVMGMVVMVMESNLFLNGTPLIKLLLTEQKMINSILDFQ